MTGKELPAALRRCLNSMPETSPKLMSRRTQTAFQNRCGLRKPPPKKTASWRSRTAAAVELHSAAFRRRHRRQRRHFYLAGMISLGLFATQLQRTAVDCKKCEPVEPLKAGGFLSCGVAIPTRWSKLLTLQNKGRKSVPGHLCRVTMSVLYFPLQGEFLAKERAIRDLTSLSLLLARWRKRLAEFEPDRNLHRWDCLSR